MKKLLMLLVAVALTGCEKDCDCGLVRDDAVSCAVSPCEYALYVDFNCGGGRWVFVDQYTWMNTFVGDQYCE
jgi:hypothetical protein